VIPEDKALPSNNSCSHIFLQKMSAIGGGDLWEVSGKPNVYCFLIPLDF
jgi:hypothetical protein